MSSSKEDIKFKKIVGRVINQVIYVENISEIMPLFPQYIHIEPTNACNLRCVHCHHARGSDGRSSINRRFGMMDMDIFRKVIDELAGHDTPVTLDTQGEPTLHPHFLDMVKYAKSKDVHLSVITNAVKLDEGLSRELVRLKLDRIVFSFDSVDEQLYEATRVRAKFKPTLKNVLRFIEINHLAGHPTHVCMSMVYRKKNETFADEYREFFNQLPVDKIFLNPLLNLAGLSPVADEIEPNEMEKQPKSDWPICRVPWESMTVNWDGEVGPCPVDVNVVYSIGNARDFTLGELWNNERMRCFRRAHINKEYELIEENGPLCGSCNCKFDKDYDLRDYGNYAVEAIYRNAVQHAHQLIEKPEIDITDKQKYENLRMEIARLEIDKELSIEIAEHSGI